jgi:hypothetical protein
MPNQKVAGSKLGTIEAVKASLKRGANSNVNYIKHVGDEGMVVRFLTEPEDWFGYQEYYDVENKQFVPMVVDEVLPDGVRPSFRYLTCALDTKTDRVVALKLAKTCANLLMIKYEKYGSVLDRNYELDRHGVGLDTTYDVTPCSPTKMNTSKYDLLELDEILDQARRIAEGEDPFDSANTPITMGDADDEDDIDTEDEATSEWGGFDYGTLFPDDEYREDYSLYELQAIGKQDADELVAIIEDWDAEPSSTTVKAMVNQILVLQGADPDEDDDGDEDEEDTSIVLDEDEMDEMSIKDLRQLADQLNVDHDGLKRGDLIAALIEANEK